MGFPIVADSPIFVAVFDSPICSARETPAESPLIRPFDCLHLVDYEHTFNSVLILDQFSFELTKLLVAIIPHDADKIPEPMSSVELASSGPKSKDRNVEIIDAVFD